MTCTLGCAGPCQGHTSPILDAINQAAAAAMDLVIDLVDRQTYELPNCRACGLVWTQEPDDVCRTCKRLNVPIGAGTRARAMRALGLPHPWAPRTRRRMFWDELQRQVYGKVFR